MSNAPYTLDKLISYLTGGPVAVRARETFGSDDKEFQDAIIAKLRAADKLCEISLGIRGILQLYKNNPDIDIGEAWLSDLEKAIAEYESGSHD